MGTLNEKLEYLSQTKEYIKEAIISKGQPVSSSDTFRSYASKIAAIENGDVITATNTTGSAVSADDKVWVNEDTTNYYAWSNLAFVIYTVDYPVTVGSALYSENGGQITPTGETVTGTDGTTYIENQFDPEMSPETYDRYSEGDESVTVYTIIPSKSVTSTSFTAIAQANIANNASGSVKTILDGNGTYAPTLGTKVITRNNTYSANTDDLYGYSSVTVNVEDIPAVVESLSITPTTSAQSFTPTSGVDGYSPVTVSAVDSTIDQNITAENIKSGVSILGVNGSVTELNGETLSVTPSTVAQTLNPTSPKNAFTEVSVSAVTSSIDANITAGNIKSGVEILGVEGTYAGETPVLEDKVITANGEYTAGQGYDGIGTATVAVNATGATEVAVNYTGSNIAAGDKVWMNQYWYSSNDSRTMNYPSNPGYSSGQHDFLTPNGQFIFLNSTGSFSNYGLWKINNDNSITKVGGSSTPSECFNYSANYPATQLALESDGVVYTQNSYGMRRIDSGWGWGHSNWYPIRGSSEIIIDKENMVLQKIDPSDGTVLKTYSFDTAPNFNNSLGSASITNGYYLGNGKIWLYHSSSGYYAREYILNDSNNIAEYQREFSDASLYLVHGYTGSAYYDGTTGINITSDYKYIIGGNIVFSIAENKNIYSETPMATYHSDGRVDYYYPDTDTWIIEYGSGILIFKYDPNTEEFTKINFDSDSHKPSSSNAHIYCISSDLSLVFSKNYSWTTHSNFWLYSTTKNVTNSLINYSQGLVSSDTITGTAAENIAAGASGNVYLGDKGTLQTKVALQNGTITPDSGYYGLKSVNVNVVETGVEVEGKNYTGAAINEGDKVWINPYVIVPGTEISYNNSEYGVYSFVTNNLISISPGTGYIYKNGINTGECTYHRYYNGSKGICFNTLVTRSGNIYSYNDDTTNRNGIGTTLVGVSGTQLWSKFQYIPVIGSNDLLIQCDNSGTITNNILVRIDPTTGNVLKAYERVETGYSYAYVVSDGGKYQAFLLTDGSIYCYMHNGYTPAYRRIILDETNNTWTYSSYSAGNSAAINSDVVYGVTPDGKYSISRNWIYKLDYDVNGLSRYTPQSRGLIIPGNTYVGSTVLFVDSSSGYVIVQNISGAAQKLDHALYKYNIETELFESVPVTLPDDFVMGCGVDENGELLYLGYNNSTDSDYNVTLQYQVYNVGNNLVNYNQITSDTQTGMATENIASGSTGTVKVGAFFEPVVETLNVTPTTSAQTITPDTGVDGYNEVLVSAVTSAIDPDIVAENIVEGVNILGVTGTAEITTLDVTTPRLVVVNNGTDGVAYTDDGGNTWSESEMPVTAEWRSIAFGNGRYVAIVETSDTTIGAYSDDGINWTQTTMPSGKYYSICYGDGKFVAISRGSSTFAYSTNGETWTSVTVPVSKNWDQIAYGNGKFVAVSSSNSTFVYSEDGINWTESTDTAGGHIMFGGGKFISSVNKTIKYSSNGVNWTAATLPTLPSAAAEANIYNIVYDGTVYLAVCLGHSNTGYLTLISSDGSTWSLTSSTTAYLAETYDTAYNLKNVNFDGTNFVGLTRNGQYTFTAGSDGLWTVTENDPALTGTDWNGLCYGEPVTGTTTVDAMLNMINGENITNYDELDDALDDLNGESA